MILISFSQSPLKLFQDNEWNESNCQVRNLRKMYEEQMRLAQEEWLKLHQSKVICSNSTLETILKYHEFTLATGWFWKVFLLSNSAWAISWFHSRQLAELEAALARERGQNSRFLLILCDITVRCTFNEHCSSMLSMFFMNKNVNIYRCFSISSGVEARELRVLVEELRRKMEEVL